MEQIIFIVKDAVLLLLFLLVLSHKHSGKVELPEGIKLSLIGYFFWVLLNVLNPSLPNFTLGIWGLKSHILYGTILLLVCVAFSNVRALFQLLARIYPILVIPVCVIGFMQLATGADSQINQTVRGGMDGISFFGEENLIRVAGTFSYLSGMAAFIQVTALIGIGLFIYGFRSNSFYVALVLVFAMLPASGSRAVIVAFAGGVLTMMFASRISQVLRLRDLTIGLSVLALLLAFGFYFQHDAWLALQQRATGIGGEEAWSRVFIAFTDAFSQMSVAGLFGFGTGSANLGAVALVGSITPFSWLPAGTDFEPESGRIVLELGIVGWFISILFRAQCLFLSYKLALRGASRDIRCAAILAIPFMTNGFYVGSGVFAASFVAAAFWFALGILALAYREHRFILQNRAVNRHHRIR